MRVKTLIVCSFLFPLMTVPVAWADKGSERNAAPKRQQILKSEPAPQRPAATEPVAAETEKKEPKISRSKTPGPPGSLDPTPVLDPQAGTVDQAPATEPLKDVTRLGSRGGPGQSALDDLPGRDSNRWDPTGGIDPTDPNSFPGGATDSTVFSPSDARNPPGGTSGGQPGELRDTSGWNRDGGTGSAGDYDYCIGMGGGSDCDGLQGGGGYSTEDDNANTKATDGWTTSSGDENNDGRQDYNPTPPGEQDTPGRTSQTEKEDQSDTYYGSVAHCDGTDIDELGRCHQPRTGDSGGGGGETDEHGTTGPQGDSTPVPDEVADPGGTPSGPPQIATGDVDPAPETERSGRGALDPGGGDIDYDEKSVAPSGGSQLRLLHGEVDPTPPDSK